MNRANIYKAIDLRLDLEDTFTNELSEDDIEFLNSLKE